MQTQQKRRQYTKAFKIEAVELLLQSKKTAVEVAGNLGIRTELLYRWKGEYLRDRKHSFPGTGHL